MKNEKQKKKHYTTDNQAYNLVNAWENLVRIEEPKEASGVGSH